MLPLVGLGLEAGPRFGWSGLGAASGRIAGARRPDVLLTLDVRTLVPPFDKKNIFEPRYSGLYK